MIPEESEKSGPGSRSDSDDHPGSCIANGSDPGVGRRRRGRRWSCRPFLHTLRGADGLEPQPGVVVAIAPRPPANVCNPYRDKDLLLSHAPILKGIDPKSALGNHNRSEAEMDERRFGRRHLCKGSDTLCTIEPQKSSTMWATEQNLRVKMNSGRVLSLGRSEVNHPCVNGRSVC